MKFLDKNFLLFDEETLFAIFFLARPISIVSRSFSQYCDWKEFYGVGNMGFF